MACNLKPAMLKWKIYVKHNAFWYLVSKLATQHSGPSAHNETAPHVLDTCIHHATPFHPHVLVQKHLALYTYPRNSPHILNRSLTWNHCIHTLMHYTHYLSRPTRPLYSNPELLPTPKPTPSHYTFVVPLGLGGGEGWIKKCRATFT